MCGTTDTNFILDPLAEFVIHINATVNQTAPLSLSGLLIYSTAWLFTVNAKLDEVFTAETRYTFYKREKTIVSITLADAVFYVSNVQQPIAIRNEIIFRNLLLTIVVLELFRLAFSIVHRL